MSLLDHLQTYVSSFTEGLLKVQRDRKRLLSELAVIAGVSEEELAIEFEASEKALRKTVETSEWSIHYNPYTDRVIFERIADVNTIGRLVELRSRNLERQLMELIRELDPYQFEHFVANVFRELPWVRRVETTQRSRDGGIDIEGQYMDLQAKIVMPLYGQVKGWESRVGYPELTKFLGALSLKHPKDAIGIFVALGGYTKRAREAAQASERTIKLYEGADLVDLMKDNLVGVRSIEFEVLTPDEEFWNELSS